MQRDGAPVRLASGLLASDRTQAAEEAEAGNAAAAGSVTNGKGAGKPPPAAALDTEQSAFIPAADLLGLIAYGRTDGFSRPAVADFDKLWGGFRPSTTLRDLPEEHGLVLLLQAKSDSAELRATASTKLERWSEADLAAAGERLDKIIMDRGKSADQLRDELLSAIEMFREDDTSREQKWQASAGLVCNAIAAGQLEVWGRRGNYAAGTIRDAIRTLIPSADVDPEFVAIVLDTSDPFDPQCWLTVPSDASTTEAQKERVEWADLSFKTGDALAWHRSRSPGGPFYGREPSDPAAPILHSGAAGRPSSMSNLIAPELARRSAAGKTLETIKAEATALSQWLASTHPHHPQASPRGIMNGLRSELWAALAAAMKPK